MSESEHQVLCDWDHHNLIVAQANRAANEAKHTAVDHLLTEIDFLREKIEQQEEVIAALLPAAPNRKENQP